MQCPHCLSYNQDAAGFCDQCGTTLRPGSRAPAGLPPARRAPWFLGVLALGLLVGVALWQAGRADRSAPPTEAPGSVPTPPQGTERPALPRPLEPRPGEPPELASTNPEPPLAELPGPAPAAGPRTLTVVQVTIDDPWGTRLATLPAVVLNERWLALPRGPCLGGTNWSTAQGESLERGDYRQGSPLGLWQLGGEETQAAVDAQATVTLRAWDPTLELEWLSLRNERVRDIRPGSGSLRGDVRVFQPVRALPGAGVFVQEDALVGWTFGEHAPGEAFLWEGRDGELLLPSLGVQDFYRFTFAGGREEHFARTVAPPAAALTRIDRLDSFARGCLRDPLLLAAETPAVYGLANVLNVVKGLVGEILQGSDVIERDRMLSLLVSRVLLEAGDPQLLLVVAAAEHGAGRAAQALALLAEVAPQLVGAGGADAQLLSALEARILRDYLQELIAAGDLVTGWAVYRGAQQRFPADAEIHLRGVELALAGGDWRTAESILGARRYPSALADLVKVLSARIAELKGHEGKIVIRFTPGSRIVPARAVLAGRFEQDFIIDTGASRTTVPESALRALGIRVPASAPRITVNTAGGTLSVPTMILPSISLGGWEVRDVDVLVLDLPDQPALGLLGLNFLDRFHVSLNVEDGVLVLEPR